MTDPKISITEGVAEYERLLVEARAALAKSQADDASDDAEYERRIAVLEAKIKSQGTSVVTLYGMNISPGTTFTNAAKESSVQQRDRVVATYGGLSVAKVFSMGGNPPSVFRPGMEGLVPGKVAFIGFKPDQNALARGDFDAQLRSYCASVPVGWKIMFINWQEPDNELWKEKIFTDAQHKAASDHLSEVVHDTPAYKDGRVEVWECFMGWSLDAASGNRFRDAAVSSKVDGIAWDYYWNNKSDVTSGFEAPLQRMLAKSKQFGKPTALLETGDNPDTFANGADRAAFWTKVYIRAEELGYKYVIYFNAIGTTGDHRILPGQSYSEPLRKMLASRMKVA